MNRPQVSLGSKNNEQRQSNLKEAQLIPPLIPQHLKKKSKQYSKHPLENYSYHDRPQTDGYYVKNPGFNNGTTLDHNYDQMHSTPDYEWNPINKETQRQANKNNKIFVIFNNPKITGFQIARIFEQFGQVKNVFFGSNNLYKNPSLQKNHSRFSSQKTDNQPKVLDSDSKKEFSYVFVTYYSQEHAFNAISAREIFEMDTKFVIKTSKKCQKNRQKKSKNQRFEPHFFQEPDHFFSKKSYDIQMSQNNNYNTIHLFEQHKLLPKDYSEDVRAFKAATMPKRLKKVKSNQNHALDNLVFKQNDLIPH